MNKIINLVSAETFFVDYYGEFLYQPIKLFYLSCQEEFSDLLYDKEKQTCEYFLDNYLKFTTNFNSFREDRFFSNFYFLLYKNNFIEKFKSFMLIYFEGFRFDVNEHLLRYLNGMDNYIYAPDLIYIPKIPLFKQYFLAEDFISPEFTVVIMRDYRPNGQKMFKMIKSLGDDIEIKAFVGNDLNIMSFNNAGIFDKLQFISSDNFYEAFDA